MNMIKNKFTDSVRLIEAKGWNSGSTLIFEGNELHDLGLFRKGIAAVRREKGYVYWTCLDESDADEWDDVPENNYRYLK